MNSSTEEPRYVHDCDKCVFLGQYRCTQTKHEARYHNYDLYVCGDNVVARYGNEGPAYSSGIEFVGTINPLTEAHKRATAMGINFEQIKREKRDERIISAYQRYKMNSEVFTVATKLEEIAAKAWLGYDNFLEDLECLLKQGEWTPEQIKAALKFISTCIDEEN